MATDTLRRRMRRSAATAAAAVIAATVSTAVTAGGAAAATAWWRPLAFAGQRVDAVTVSGSMLAVQVGSLRYVSTDSGRTFASRGPAAGAPSPPGPVVVPAAAPPAAPSVSGGGRTWSIHDGVVVGGPSGGALRPDPGAPFLGAAARLIAAPAALPGVVVAVGSDGHVWRRGQDGGWATAFALLPAGGLSGVPAVTGLAAFNKPLSAAVYLATDGYGVLLSSDGGDDWLRSGTELPERVLGLAADPATSSLYAATADGLWVHTLQAFPAPPVYHDADLVLRWLGIGAVALLAMVLGLAALGALLPRGSVRLR